MYKWVLLEVVNLSVLRPNIRFIVFEALKKLFHVSQNKKKTKGKESILVPGSAAGKRRPNPKKLQKLPFSFKEFYFDPFILLNLILSTFLLGKLQEQNSGKFMASPKTENSFFKEITL